MMLVQDGQTVCSVSSYERRVPDRPSGPALIWFEVPAGVELDLAASYDLVAEGSRQPIQLLDYEPLKAIVIAIEADSLHVSY